MKNPEFVTVEKEKNMKALILDSEGYVGAALEKALSADFYVTYISSVKLLSKAVNTLPVIPERKFSHIFVVSGKETDYAKFIGQITYYSSHTASRIVGVFNYRFISKIVSLLRKKNSREVFIGIGDIFGESIPSSTNTVTHLLAKAQTAGRVLVRGNGLSQLQPVHIDDAVFAILEGVFGSYTESVLYAFKKTPLTEIGFAHMLQQLDPLIQVDFDHKKDEQPQISPHEGIFLLKDTYDVKKRLQLVFKPNDLRYTEDTSSFSLPHISGRRFFSPKTALVFFIEILTLLLAPLMVTSILVGIGLFELRSSYYHLQQGKFQEAYSESKRGEKVLSWARPGVSVIAFEGNLVGMNNLAKKGEEMFESLQEAADGFVNGFSAVTTFIDVLKGTAQNPQEEFVQATNSLKSSLSSIQRLQAASPFSSEVKKSTKRYDATIQLASGAVDVLPSLFGFVENKKYLILFQNNMELRPGGGFIGSYGLVSLKQGKITDFTIRDVYDADGQLKGHVEPPYGLRKYMGAKHWFLRDSNFDVDFSRSATASAFFLREETGEEVDGIIGIDLSFIQKLLRVLGPISLPDYNETVTSDNFFEKTESHVEKNFFPGSTQKKDFLQALFSQIQKKLTTDKKLPYLGLLEALDEALAQKHLLLAFQDARIQQLFQVQRGASTLWDPRSVKENAIQDFIGLVDANIGGNKVNYFIKRKVSSVVSIKKDGVVEESIVISYKNTSDGTWPGGEYKNYLRIILPQGALLTNIKLDGADQKIVYAETNPIVYESKTFKKPQGLEVEKGGENEKTIYGFLVTVPISSSKTIQIIYTLPYTISSQRPDFSYSLFFFKQPGIDEEPFQTTILYPGTYKVISSSQKVTAAAGRFSFSATGVKDEHLDVLLSQ